MFRTTLRVEKCCSLCQRPVSRCSHPTGKSSPIYDGILLRGQWVRVQTPQAQVQEEVRTTAAAA